MWSVKWAWLGRYRTMPSPSPHSFAIQHSSDRQRSSTPALNSAVPGPFPDRSRTAHGPFRDSFRTVRTTQNVLRPSPTISGPFYRTVPVAFLNLFRTVSRPFPGHSRTTPGSFRPFAARTPTVITPTLSLRTQLSACCTEREWPSLRRTCPRG